MAQIILRPAIPSESDALTDLTRRSKASHGYDENFMRIIWDDMVISTDQIERDTVMVAEREGQILGFAHLMTVDKPDTIYLENLYVDPDAQGLGLGRMLMEWAVSEAGKRRIPWLEWDSDPNSTAFYTKMGGEQISEIESTTFPGRTIPKFRRATS